MGLLTEPNHLLLGATQPLYQIDRSLRFNDDDSAYLNRTFGAPTSRRTFTLSVWAKRGSLGGATTILGCAGTREVVGFFGNTSGSGDALHYRDTTGGAYEVTTTAVFRDPSAWYHCVVAWDTTQATAANRVKMYINGVQITSFSVATYPAQNTDLNLNSAVVHAIGRRGDADIWYFDGYMAEVHFIDGTALDPTSFGELDTNGVWRPIQVSGLTYGTNGFYLSFADNTSTTTLGYDDAGSNDWTLNNFSVAAGAGNDSLEDTPTNNYCVLNAVTRSTSSNAPTPANGNLDWVTPSGSTITTGWPFVLGTIGVSSGKWYYEIDLTVIETNAVLFGGWITPDVVNDTDNTDQLSKIMGFLIRNDSASTGLRSAVGGVYTTQDGADATTGVYQIAFDFDAGKFWLGRGGTWYASGDPSAGTSEIGTFTAGLTMLPFIGCQKGGSDGDSSVSMNFGQRPFAYTPPTGFSALCTANLPTPDIADPGSYMNAVTYTGTGSSLAVTGVGFQPDLVWIKGRSGATDHALYDSTRGVQKQIESNTTTNETAEATGLTAFGADGFTVGALAQVNTSSATYVGWCWKEGVTPGFDIVSYTGTGVARTIAHNLGTAPKMVIVKNRTTGGAGYWLTWHANMISASYYLAMNLTIAQTLDTTVWNATAPTASVFSLGTNPTGNNSGTDFIAYLFAEVEGFSRFGTYTGNGSADGPFVWTSFLPRYVLIKRTGTATNWRVFDTARDTINVMQRWVYPNGADAELTGASLDALANGFKIRSSDAAYNASSETYIFAAFASQPFSAPANAR